MNGVSIKKSRLSIMYHMLTRDQLTDETICKLPHHNNINYNNTNYNDIKLIVVDDVTSLVGIIYENRKIIVLGSDSDKNNRNAIALINTLERLNSLINYV